MDGTKLTGLWKNQTKDGKPYLSGSLGLAKLMIFPNDHKREGEKGPDYLAYLVPVEKKPERKPTQQDAGF